MYSRKFHITTNNKKVDLCETIVIRNGKIVWKIGPLYRIITTNLGFCGSLQLHARVLANMALADFDAVLDIIESDFLVMNFKKI